jgi:hypothetical protein
MRNLPLKQEDSLKRNVNPNLLRMKSKGPYDSSSIKESTSSASKYAPQPWANAASSFLKIYD